VWSSRRALYAYAKSSPWFRDEYWFEWCLSVEGYLGMRVEGAGWPRSHRRDDETIRLSCVAERDYSIGLLVHCVLLAQLVLTVHTCNGAPCRRCYVPHMINESLVSVEEILCRPYASTQGLRSLDRDWGLRRVTDHTFITSRDALSNRID
jgi:hypothetical protein